MWANMCIRSLFYLALLLFTLSECNIIETSRHDVRKFPDGFIFGVATSAYQIEGGWNADGKSENIWDHFTHSSPDSITDKSNGDVACDSYNQYKRDVEMMRELGVDFYRFSLSWSRILPSSFPNKINEAGIQYYNNLIDEMLKYNIQPMVTLYHWDLPQTLQEMGGWTNPHIVDWYTDYARVAFEHFGDRVKYWVTINEPNEICRLGYGTETAPPRVNISGFADYLCVKNLLVAHAKAYHLYDEVYRPVQQGNISITIHGVWFEPESKDDIEATEDTLNLVLGIYAHPIFSKTGDWPPRMKERIAAKSAAQGFSKSRLPDFTPEEIETVRGSSDFFGLNHYTTKIVYKSNEESGVASYEDDLGALSYQPEEWDSTASYWFKAVPWGFYNLLTWIKEEYNNPPLIITENGYSTEGGLVDEDRVKFYRDYLNAILDAIDNGSDIFGYTAWSLMDNFEWTSGYTARFGIYEVDFNSPEKTRTPRKSAFVYKEIVRTRALDPHYEPSSSVMTIDEGQ